jgi:hypothetical protein
MSAVTDRPPSTFGVPALRAEDPRFLRGEGRYLENIQIEGACGRSSFDPSSPMRGSPGWKDWTRLVPCPAWSSCTRPIDLEPPAPAARRQCGGSRRGAWISLRSRVARPRSARGSSANRSRVVIAETSGQAQDAAETDQGVGRPDRRGDRCRAGPRRTALRCCSRRSARTSPTASSTTGTRTSSPTRTVVVEGRFVNQRLAPAPMETDGIAVVPEGRRLHRPGCPRRCRSTVRNDLAELLGVDSTTGPPNSPRRGWGLRREDPVYPEYLACREGGAAVGQTGPVVRVPQRIDCWGSGTGGRRCSTSRSVRAVTGTVVGDARGHRRRHGRLPIGAFLPADHRRDARGGLSHPADRLPRAVVVTNATPVGAYRGAGRPEASACVRTSDGHARPGADDRPGRTPSEEPDPGGGVPVHDGDRKRPTTPATTPQRSIARSTWPVTRTSRTGTGGPPRAGDPRLLGIGVRHVRGDHVVLVEGVRARGRRGRRRA